jgi:hypothetical protein
MDADLAVVIEPLILHFREEHLKMMLNPGNIVLMDVWPGPYKKCIKWWRTQNVGM